MWFTTLGWLGVLWLSGNPYMLLWSPVTGESSAGLVNQQRLADIGDFRDGAFQVKRLGEHNLEDL
jgi:hypothetical protein